jgi:hypothetical protein
VCGVLELRLPFYIKWVMAESKEWNFVSALVCDRIPDWDWGCILVPFGALRMNSLVRLRHAKSEEVGN